MTAYNELTNFDISGKNILIREDLNVPVYNNQIVNDARILAAIPTIKYALSNGAKVAIISHFGRPKEGIFDKKYSLMELAGGETMFAATGVTMGSMLKGVRRFKGGAMTHSLIMRSKSGTVRYIEAEHNFNREND